MFNSNLRFVPWKNREAWLKVYEDAYSKESDRQAKACQTMELWLVLRNDVPPGVECTLNILSAMQNQDKPRQLQLILSTAVVRVVNMLCDNARQTGYETIYSIVKYYNLPDWIVNLRHDVSHGSSLPDLSSLKRAAVFLLAWLKDYYWEVEKENMKDIVLKRSRYEACKDSVEFYMKLYVELSELFIQSGNIRVKKFNETLKLKLYAINDYHGIKCAIECVPWIVHSKSSFAEELSRDELNEMRLSKLIDSTLNFIKDYVVKIDFWEVDSLEFIINSFSKHFKMHNYIVLEVWSRLIQKLNEWEILGRLLKKLCLYENLKDYGLSKWSYEIIRAIVKRDQVDKMKDNLSSTSMLSQDDDEQVAFGKAMLRKRLTLSIDASEIDVLKKLFKLVEKKQVDFKGVIRLSAPVNYIIDSCSAVNIIKSLVLHPDKLALSNLEYLLKLGNPEFPEIKKKELTDLLLIQLGKKSSLYSSSSNRKIKTVEDLIKDEKEFVSRLSNFTKNNELKNIENCDNVTTDMKFLQPDCQIVRSAWNFSRYPLGVSPWEMEGVEYYHKCYDPKTSSPSYVFPVSKRPRFSEQI